MRNIIMLLTAAAIVVACADETPPTGPASGSHGRSASPNAQATAEKAPVGDAKPVDQVGFTKVIQVMSAPVVVLVNNAGSATATCPVGTMAISGGHQFTQWTGSTPAQMTMNQRNWENGWVVTFYNQVPGATQFTFKAIAYCAS